MNYLPIVLTLSLFAGCTFVFDAGRGQCETTRDCTRRGEELAEAVCREGLCRIIEEPECIENDDCSIGMTCVEQSCEGRPMENWSCLRADGPRSGQIDFVVPVVDLSRQPVPEVSFELCALFDADCTEPSMQLTSGDDGVVKFKQPGDFSGYLQLGAEQTEYFAMLYHLPPALPSGAPSLPFTLVPPSISKAFQESGGLAMAADRGGISVRVVDCDGALPGGIVFKLRSGDEETVTYYSKTTPTVDLTETEPGYGAGGFVNAPATTSVIDVVLVETEQIIASLPIVVRAGATSLVHLMPAPVRPVAAE